MFGLTKLRPWPSRWSFPAAGAALAAAAPIGLLLVRLVHSGARPTPSWIGAELAGGASTYAYIACYASATFVCLGWLLGRVEDQLRAGALTDPLTGLANRRHFEARLAGEITRAQRYGDPLALLLIDVDGLKEINDHGGHAAGDAALRRVAMAIVGTCRRTTDLAARIGGDELAVLAPSTSATQAQVLAERIRATLRRAATDGVPVTVSIGVADCERVGACDAELLRRGADRALYRAKAGGRDRSVVEHYRHTRRFFLAPPGRKEVSP